MDKTISSHMGFLQTPDLLMSINKEIKTSVFNMNIGRSSKCHMGFLQTLLKKRIILFILLPMSFKINLGVREEENIL